MWAPVLLSTLAAFVGLATAATPTATSAQLSTFANSTTGPIGILTTSSGCPVQLREVASVVNTDLIRNEYFIETLNHLISERIPERIGHAKGNGAFGYFEVTHNITDLTKAKFLSEIGKKTRVAVRFSTTIPSRGGSDISDSVRGFAIKFYTEEGNWDLTGMHTPVFAIRDPVKFIYFLHAIKRNVATDLTDFNMTWDFIVNNPESFLTFLLSVSPYGIPDGNRHMRGHSIHTMQLANSLNETNFARFYFEPDLGLKNMTRGTVTDTDYFLRELYDAIGAGSYPSWTAYVQHVTYEQALKSREEGIDVFDVTRPLSQETFPLRPIGKLVLNENPKNYFADIEQLAFCPGNVVPGIVGAPDSMFKARAFAYRAAAVHRLGINFNKIPVNRPINKVLTYSRDGAEPNLDNEGGAPNYYPNTFNGPEPIPDHQPSIIQWDELVVSNADEISKFFQSLREDEKNDTVSEIRRTLTSGVTDDLIQRSLALFKSIDQDLYDRVSEAIGA